MRYRYTARVSTNMGLDVGLYPSDAGTNPEECADEAYRLLRKAAEFHWHWMAPERREVECVRLVAEAVRRAMEFDGPPLDEPALAAIQNEVVTWGRAGGPFPTYADAPAWESTGALVEGGVAVVGGAVTASLGMLARGDAGPTPRAGVYTPYDAGAGGSRFVRPLREGEAELAVAAIAAERSHTERWEAAWATARAAVERAALEAAEQVAARLGAG